MKKLLAQLLYWTKPYILPLGFYCAIFFPKSCIANTLEDAQEPSTVVKEECSNALDEPLTLDVLVFINEVRKGETLIIIQQEGEEDSESPNIIVDFAPIRTLLKKELSKEHYQKEITFFESPERFIKPFETPSGICVKYNEEVQAITVDIPPLYAKQQTTFLRNRSQDCKEEATIPQADWSGYINIFGEKSMEYLHASRFINNHTPSYLGLNFVLHHSLWTLETDVNLGSFCFQKGFWGDITLTRDLPDDNKRLAFGNVSPNVLGYQIGIPLLGFSVDRDPSLFDTTSDIADKKFDFFLEKPAKIAIYINENLVKELSLPAGKHSLQNFPFVKGKNDVKIKIHSETEKDRELFFQSYYGLSLLPPGEYFSSWGLGFPQNIVCGSGYNWKTPVFTSSIMYGATARLTCGSYFQCSPLQFQIGGQTVWSFPTFRATLNSGFCSCFGKTSGFQALALFEKFPNHEEINPLQWSARVECRGPHFDLGLYHSNHHGEGCHEREDHHFTRAIIAYNCSKTLLEKYYASGSIECSLDEKWYPSFYLSAGISRTYNQYLSVSLTGYSTLNKKCQKDDKGLLFCLSTGIPNANIYNRTSYTTVKDAICTQSYYSRQLSGMNSFNGSIGYEMNRDQSIVNSSMGYIGDYIEATAFTSLVDLPACQNERAGKNGSLSVSIATCIAFADGTFALSRPIADSFILIAPQGELAPYGIEVNPLGGDCFTAISRGKLPAVLSRSSSYSTIPVTISSEHLPMGYLLGKSNFLCKTTYRSGTLLKIGQGYFVLAEGRLLDGSGTGIKCAFGSVKRTDGTGEAIAFFTNREGEFQIEGLNEGAYELTLYDKKWSCTSFIVEHNVSGLCNIGDLILTSPTAEREQNKAES